MLSSVSDKTKKDDLKLFFLCILCIFFVIWNIVCWGKQLDQITFVLHKIQHSYMLVFKKDTVSEYKYHRNNAVLFTRLYNKTKAYEEINMAIQLVPSHLKAKVENDLYKDKAQIESFFGDYKLALSDYVKVNESLSTLDKCRVGILFGYIGNRKYAVKYCNDALQEDPNFYLGWACVADAYASVGRYDVAVKLYDYFIENAQTKSARYYMDRAYYKKKNGDMIGYEDDVAIALEKNPSIKEDITIIADTIKPPKGFTLILE